MVGKKLVNPTGVLKREERKKMRIRPHPTLQVSQGKMKEKREKRKEKKER